MDPTSLHIIIPAADVINDTLIQWFYGRAEGQEKSKLGVVLETNSTVHLKHPCRLSAILPGDPCQCANVCQKRSTACGFGHTSLAVAVFRGLQPSGWSCTTKRNMGSCALRRQVLIPSVNGLSRFPSTCHAEADVSKPLATLNPTSQCSFPTTGGDFRPAYPWLFWDDLWNPCYSITAFFRHFVPVVI